MGAYTVLAINPGSTSTKIAVYEDEKELFRGGADHDAATLAKFSCSMDQLSMREQAILDCLAGYGFDFARLSAIAGRGGPLPPVKHGAYLINEAMVDYLSHRADSDHPSKLGAVLAYGIAQRYSVPAYIYDSIRVDEVDEAARFSGLPELPRKPGAHVLNMRAVAVRTAKKIGRSLADCNFVVAHLGGGITLSAISGGRLIDYVGDDEGPFSPERAGRLPYRRFIDLCYSGRYTRAEMMRAVRGKGGLVGCLGTNSALEVEKRIAGGDENAGRVYHAMAYQVAKAIGELSTVVMGKVDAVILTGGIAHSKMFTGWIAERVKFIAPVEVVPGENELEALAFGILRVLKNEEEAHTFTEA